MRRFWPAVALVTLACGSSPPPAPSPGGNPVAETITGRERIGWTQQADNTAELATFRYAMYVDGARSEIAAVNCAGTADASGFACSGALPPMTAGLHTLELASFVVNEDGVNESARSPGVRVQVTAAMAPAGEWEGAVFTTREGVALRADRIAEGLRAPVDAAFAGANLFIAQRGGVRVFTGGRLHPEYALQLDSTGDAMSPRVLSLTAAPDYARSRFVFVVQAAMTRGGAVFQLARYRELHGTFGERAVVYQTAAPSVTEASAAVRFGPDGKLYLALGGFDGDGRVVRLNADGMLPRDQAGTTPAIAGGLEAARGVAWDPRSNLLWVADEKAETAHLSALSLSSPPVRAAVRARRTLQTGIGTLEFYAAETFAGMRGDALLASAEGAILRIRFADTDPTRAEFVDRVFESAGLPVRAVAVAPDGTIYFCTDSALGRLGLMR